MAETKSGGEAAGGDEARTVHLVSQEGESFDVPLNTAKMSELVKTMIDEDQDEDEAQEIPLPNVKSGILAKVFLFIYSLFLIFLYFFKINQSPQSFFFF